MSVTGPRASRTSATEPAKRVGEAAPAEKTKETQQSPGAAEAGRTASAYTTAKETDDKTSQVGPSAARVDVDRSKMGLGKLALEEGGKSSGAAKPGAGAGAPHVEKDYEVKKGDNLWNIIKKHNPSASNAEIQTMVKDTAKNNGIKNPDLIHPGQKLKIPTEPATVTDAAKPSKTPTAKQIKEIQSALDGKDYQKAIDLTAKYYGIDTSNVKGKLTYDSSLTDANAETSPDRSVKIGPSSVEGVSPGRLAATLLHETTHANQIKNHGWPKNGQEVAAYEAMGYQAALSQAKELGLTQDQKDWYQGKVDHYRNKLSGDNQKKYDSGQYWDLK